MDLWRNLIYGEKNLIYSWGKEFGQKPQPPSPP